MNSTYCIYTSDDRYVGLAYGEDAARAMVAKGCRAVPYLDHVAPECRPDTSPEHVAAEVEKWRLAGEDFTKALSGKEIDRRYGAARDIHRAKQQPGETR
jgi:hypothetical protein